MLCVSWQGGSVPKIKDSRLNPSPKPWITSIPVCIAMTSHSPKLTPKPALTSSPGASDDEYRMIEVLEKSPTLSQRDLASVLGFSLGKVNYCLKALVDKGLIKATHFVQNPNKGEYAYLLTPKGIGSKAVLTAQFLERKMMQYEALKAEIDSLKAQAVRSETPANGLAKDRRGP